MGLIDNTSKAIRLLISRRYTSGDLTTAQEAFTSTLDIKSSEVYTQDHLVPTSSLPFSGSSQDKEIYTSGGSNIMKYWYRQKMTKSNVDRDVWFFLSTPGSNSGITPQLIDSAQTTNFISAKYSNSSLANAATEDATPGYNVVVYKSTSLDSGSLDASSKVSTNDYQFDYKTGVLQFDANKPGSSDYVYVTAYQYVGTTLADDNSSDMTGVFALTGSIGAANTDIEITGSLGLSFTGASKYFNIEVNGEEKLKINGEGILQLISQSSVPTAVEGGIYYSSDDNLYLGTNN